jgi:hypothetical protein
MEQILLVNPRARASTKERAKLSRAAKGRRRNALGEFVGGRVRKNPRKRRPAVRERSYHHERWSTRAHPRGAMGEFVRKNPRGSSRRGSRKLVHVRAYTRHNPRGFIDEAMGTLTDSAWGVGGALATELAVGYLPLPGMLKTGVPGAITKVFIALGIGALAGMAGLQREGKYLALGGITVPAYAELKDAIATHAPNIKLGGDMAYFNPGYPAGVGELGMFTSAAAPAVVPLHPSTVQGRR